MIIINPKKEWCHSTASGIVAWSQIRCVFSAISIKSQFWVFQRISPLWEVLCVLLSLSGSVNSPIRLFKHFQHTVSLPSAAEPRLHKHAWTEPLRKINSWASYSSSSISSRNFNDDRYLHFHLRNRVRLQIQQVSESEICLHSWTEYFRGIFHDHLFMGKFLTVENFTKKFR